MKLTFSLVRLNDVRIYFSFKKILIFVCILFLINLEKQVKKETIFYFSQINSYLNLSSTART